VHCWLSDDSPWPMAHGARLVRLGNSGKSKEAPLFRSGRRGSGTMGARDTVCCAVWARPTPARRRPATWACREPAPGGWMDRWLHRPNPVQIWRALPLTRFPTPKHASTVTIESLIHGCRPEQLRSAAAVHVPALGNLNR
jgi:hypothetical protein